MVFVSVQWFVFWSGLGARCCMSLYVSAWLFIRVQVWCYFPGVFHGCLCGVQGSGGNWSVRGLGHGWGM